MTEERRRLGLVVIGQSPRPDVEAQIRAFVGADIAVELRGALDGMTRQEIARIAPQDGMDTLFTRLPDGEAVTVSKQIVEQRVGAAVRGFVREGTAAVLLCCTGAFPGLEAEAVVIRPSAVLSALAEAILPRGRLGLFLPLPEQTEQLSRKWRRPGLEVVAVPLVPGAPEEATDEAAQRMQALRPDLVVMDCISYTQRMKDRVRQAVQAPVILAISAAARVVGELLA